jgi:hypothetical protein
MELSGQFHEPAALPPLPSGQEARWTSETVWTRWRREKYLPLPGIGPQASILQPSYYTYRATPIKAGVFPTVELWVEASAHSISQV